jgi:alkaline phosphatase D
MKRTLFIAALTFVAGFPIIAGAQDSGIQRLVFGSCLKQGEPQPIWDAVEAADPQALVLLGDNIYYTGSDEKERLAAYKQNFSQPPMERLKRAAKFFALWDDNDYGAEDGGSDFTLKEKSKSTFLEAINAAPDDPRRSRKGIYSSEFLGPEGERIQIILLDTRTFRAPLVKNPAAIGPDQGPYKPNPELTATILGGEQWAWLAEELKKETEVRIIASSIQILSDAAGYESWGNFPYERERLFKFLKESERTKTILISGDRHHAEISVRKDLLTYPLYDITSSSLNKPRAPGKEDNILRVGERYLNQNFGVLNFRWGEKPSVFLEIRDLDGRPVSVQTLDL